MKSFRNARLILTLAPLCLAAVVQPAPGLAAASAATPVLLPAGAPPLTAAEKQKQQARLARFYQDLNALKQDSTQTDAQKQQKFVAMKKSLDQDMLAILSPAQRKAVLKQNQTVVKLRQAFFKQHAAEIAQSKQLGEAYTKSLTPAEKQKFAEIQQQAQAQAQKVQADPKMNPQVKQTTLAAIGRDAQRQILAVLTPTQQAQVKQFQALQARLSQELMTYARAHGQQ